MKTGMLMTATLAGMILLVNCIKDPDPSTTITDVTGYAQKGPFINGSSVTIFDLHSDFSPSGKSFNTQISDNQGTFELNNIELSSNYISLRADGFYYNEVTGQPSTAQITLYALADITGNSNININTLTTLEKGRVEYLLKNGKSFSESKIQAQNELLAIFNIKKDDIKPFENLNISENNEDNAILLAISAILQGNHLESELSELLANINNDIIIDGILNSDTLCSELINQAILLDTNLVKINLINRYINIGVIADIPDFGKYVKVFIDSTTYTFTDIIEYPDSGRTGPNILAPDRFIYPNGTSNHLYDPSPTITAKLPKGTSIKVIFSPDFIEDETGTDPEKGHYSDYGIWSLPSTGWATLDSLYLKNRTQILFNTESNRMIDAKFDLINHGGATITIYENKNTLPTRTKHITW